MAINIDTDTPPEIIRSSPTESLERSSNTDPTENQILQAAARQAEAVEAALLLLGLRDIKRFLLEEPALLSFEKQGTLITINRRIEELPSQSIYDLQLESFDIHSLKVCSGKLDNKSDQEYVCSILSKNVVECIHKIKPNDCNPIIGQLNLKKKEFLSDVISLKLFRIYDDSHFNKDSNFEFRLFYDETSFYIVLLNQNDGDDVVSQNKYLGAPTVRISKPESSVLVETGCLNLKENALNLTGSGTMINLDEYNEAVFNEYKEVYRYREQDIKRYNNIINIFFEKCTQTGTWKNMQLTVEGRNIEGNLLIETREHDPSFGRKSTDWTFNDAYKNPLRIEKKEKNSTSLNFIRLYDYH
tara:strand:- start:674 stop:1744 length:1071 start_codon:yes stop_codon:yes gene_type:complete